MMKPVLALTVALLGVSPMAAPAPARAQQQTPLLREGTQVVVVGKVSSPPKGAIEEKKMQVAIGPDKTDYTLHFRKARLRDMHGKQVDEDAFDDGMWVRAEGRVMKDPRRIEVSSVQIIGKDEGALKQSAFYHPSFGYGYVSASRVAGMRETFPRPGADFTNMAAPFVIVGRVSDDTGNLETTRKLQVDAAGNTWTLNVPKSAEVRDTKGEKISVHEVSKGQWVRAYGWRIGDLRLRADRLENIGQQEAFRTSSLYRADFPLGYVEPLEGENRFAPFNLSGTVRAIYRDSDSVLVVDDQGREHVVYTDTFRLRRGDTAIGLDTLRVGDRVTVEGRTIRFN